MGFNAKLFEVVVYPESFDINTLNDKLNTLSGCRNYAYCLHDKDEKKEHCHIMLRMNDTNNSDYVAKWFDATPAQVERCKGKWSDMLAYLTHANASEKFQYEPGNVVSNFDWQLEAKKAGKSGQRLSEIIDGISSGLIRPFNLHDYITASEFVRYKGAINSAQEYRVRSIKGVHREMKSIYLWGESGTGKTTYAKTIAAQEGYSLFISSGSNDVLDGYEGQDCIILDDLRSSSLGLSDLLKMLDPRTASSVKSRYYNKVLECKLIIITTTQPMDTFFKNVFESEKEPLKQFERRCQTIFHMTKKTIQIGIYQNKSARYHYLDPIPNMVLASLNIRDYTEDEIINMADDLL